TRSLGEGHARPVQPAGPAEVRTVALNFNAMLEQLQANERERAVMLAGLPHDLRAPLSRMKLRLAMLDDDDARDGLQRDCAAIEHLAEQFVAYLRGLQPAAQSMLRLDLAHLVRETVARYAGAGRDVRVVEAEEGDISGDRAALVRLFDNLIANGLSHGAPPVELAVRRRGERMVLAVRDHGPGIAPEQRARALEAFVQLDTQRQTEGACGLGLAIVERIARAHGAELVLDQAAPQGLLVEVRFPLAAAG
ncbi:MAG: hypothetical protein JNJ60_18265, partial [Rhodocyclaceae bacterium]|nr:hypothetical protein [Rhodocyclaceae bacterium]